MIKETDLYPPIRNYFVQQGYEVKGEVKHCDVVAMRGDEPPLVVELKTTLNLELIMQAADRLSLTPNVYIAFPSSAPLWKRQWRRLRVLCKRLGVGVLTVEGKALKVKVRLVPAPYHSRGSKKRLKRLVTEFEGRVGDQNAGGSTHKTIITAYRQDALRCAAVLKMGALTLPEIRVQSNIERAGILLQKNHYAWFERVSRGSYQLTEMGHEA
ncbi:MAG: DUF2161 family putative PD-(D/E)XK-type phosphodiesterase, partial [Arenicellales bacterium]